MYPDPDAAAGAEGQVQHTAYRFVAY